jgi:hypothetical protein
MGATKVVHKVGYANARSSDASLCGLHTYAVLSRHLNGCSSELLSF